MYLFWHVRNKLRKICELHPALYPRDCLSIWSWKGDLNMFLQRVVCFSTSRETLLADVRAMRHVGTNTNTHMNKSLFKRCSKSFVSWILMHLSQCGRVSLLRWLHTLYNLWLGKPYSPRYFRATLASWFYWPRSLGSSSIFYKQFITGSWLIYI